MAIDQIKKAGSPTDDTLILTVSKLQDNVHEWAQQFVGNDLIDGHQISSISITTGVTNVNHTLSQDLKGWFIVDKNANVTVWRNSGGTIPSSVLQLQGSGTATISVWVF